MNFIDEEKSTHVAKICPTSRGTSDGKVALKGEVLKGDILKVVSV